LLKDKFAATSKFPILPEARRIGGVAELKMLLWNNYFFTQTGWLYNFKIQHNFIQKMPRLHNMESMKGFRKHLRNHTTSAEAVFWNMLKNKQVGGLKFRRQNSIGRFVTDFYCPILHLAIELDGEPHATPAGIEKDIKRDRFLNDNGVTVFRYENRWVFEYPDVIKNDILEFAREKGIIL
jgi:very-short-patch-repair endonuclease